MRGNFTRPVARGGGGGGGGHLDRHRRFAVACDSARTATGEEQQWRAMRERSTTSHAPPRASAPGCNGIQEFRLPELLACALLLPPNWRSADMVPPKSIFGNDSSTESRAAAHSTDDRSARPGSGGPREAVLDSRGFCIIATMRPGLQGASTGSSGEGPAAASSPAPRSTMVG